MRMLKNVIFALFCGKTAKKKNNFAINGIFL